MTRKGMLGVFGLALAALLAVPTVAAGDPPRAQFLPIYGNVSGTVRDARNNAPIAGITAQLWQLDSGVWEATGTATTNALGAYSISVPIGTYKLGFRDAKGFFAEKGWPYARQSVSGSDVTVLPGSTADATLTPAGHLRIRLVTEATGGPVPAPAWGNVRDLLLPGVSTAKSAFRSAIPPIPGRLPRSRSPPQPKTTTSLRVANGRTASSARSSASGVWA
jgi:hypothetical protein